MVFDGVDSAFYLWCNESGSGTPRTAACPRSLTLRRICGPAKIHKLVVFRYCDGSYLEDQDMEFMAYSLCLAVAKTSGSHYGFSRHRELDDRYRRCAGCSGGHRGCPGHRIALSLYDTNDFSCPVMTMTPQGLGTRQIDEKGAYTNRCGITQSIASPQAWSAEEPVLYRLTVSLFNQYGQFIEAEACDVGFGGGDYCRSVMSQWPATAHSRCEQARTRCLHRPLRTACRC